MLYLKGKSYPFDDHPIHDMHQTKIADYATVKYFWSQNFNDTTHDWKWQTNVKQAIQSVTATDSSMAVIGTHFLQNVGNSRFSQDSRIS